MIIQKTTFKNRINTLLVLLFNKVQTPILERIYKKPIGIIAYANRFINYTIKNNLGDDLNFDFIECALGVKAVKYEFSILAKKRRIPTFSFIGSILEYVVQINPYAIVWGTGFKFADNDYTYEDLKNLDIRAVRGPRTRAILVSKGINCPNIYGDPAILLSKVYTPQVRNKRYRLGIIPHKDDFSNPVFTELSKRDDVIILNLKKYISWKRFIDEMSSCDFIVSTSLHGIIISDSYLIPNMWISVSNLIEGGDFKYYDYYEGVSKTPIKKQLSLETPYDEILSWKSLWVKPIISSLFIDSCPIAFKSNGLL